MTQKPTVEQLIPLVADDDQELKHHWDYLYEPDAKSLLDGLLVRYVESRCTRPWLRTTPVSRRPG